MACLWRSGRLTQTPAGSHPQQMDGDQVKGSGERQGISGAIIFGNKTRFPLNYINVLSVGDVEVP